MDKLLAELLAEMATAPGADDDYSFWTYEDLRARRIVGSRTDLHRKQRYYGFPKPVILTAGQGAAALFKIAAVKAWLLQREALAATNQPPKLKPGGRPRGRPRKHPASPIL